MKAHTAQPNPARPYGIRGLRFGVMRIRPIMKLNKIVRRAGQLERADKSAMCAINRHLLMTG